MKKGAILIFVMVFGLVSGLYGMTAAAGGTDSEGNLTGTGTVIGKGDFMTLRIPMRIELIIDPWKTDGEKSVYSKQYIVKNCGERGGWLTLFNLKCTSQEDEVSVQSDRDRLRDSDGRAIYLEMVFGEDMIVLSEEASECKKWIEPGEEVILYFAGDVNENAPNKWNDDDVTVTVFYSWENGIESDIGESY